MEENKKVAPNQPEEINEDQLDNVAGGSRYVYSFGSYCSACRSVIQYTSDGVGYCPKCNPEKAQ